MNKYINITKDNFNDYLFTDIECEFSDYKDFNVPKKGELIGIYKQPSDDLLFSCSNTMGYDYCRTKNPDYKETKLNDLPNMAKPQQLDDAGYFRDIKGPSKSIPDYKETKISDLSNMTDKQLKDAGFLGGDNGMPYYKPIEKHADLLEILGDIFGNYNELRREEGLHNLLKAIIKRLPE